MTRISAISVNESAAAVGKPPGTLKNWLSMTLPTILVPVRAEQLGVDVVTGCRDEGEQRPGEHARHADIGR
jgi:hypothetical protein